MCFWRGVFLEGGILNVCVWYVFVNLFFDLESLSWDFPLQNVPIFIQNSILQNKGTTSTSFFENQTYFRLRYQWCGIGWDSKCFFSIFRETIDFDFFQKQFIDKKCPWTHYTFLEFSVTKKLANFGYSLNAFMRILSLKVDSETISRFIRR